MKYIVVQIDSDQHDIRVYQKLDSSNHYNDIIDKLIIDLKDILPKSSEYRLDSTYIRSDAKGGSIRIFITDIEPYKHKLVDVIQPYLKVALLTPSPPPEDMYLFHELGVYY